MLAVQSIDLILFRETGTKSIDPFSSLVISNVKLSMQKGNKSLGLNASISDILAYDRSFRPGVCVLARKYYRREVEDPKPPHRDFIAAKIQVSESSGSTVVKFDLQFGKIIFMVMPSLLQGLLGFHAEIGTYLRKDDSQARENPKDDQEGTKKSSFLLRNVEFFFSFVVDGFECVLSSKEIAFSPMTDLNRVRMPPTDLRGLSKL